MAKRQSKASTTQSDCGDLRHESAKLPELQWATIRDQFDAVSTALSAEWTNAKTRPRDLEAVEERIDSTYRAINAMLEALKHFYGGVSESDPRDQSDMMFRQARHLHTLKYEFYRSIWPLGGVPFFRLGERVTVFGTMADSFADEILRLVCRHVTHVDILDIFPIDDGRPERPIPTAFTAAQFNAICRSLDDDQLRPFTKSLMGDAASMKCTVGPDSDGVRSAAFSEDAVDWHLPDEEPPDGWTTDPLRGTKTEFGKAHRTDGTARQLKAALKKRLKDSVWGKAVRGKTDVELYFLNDSIRRTWEKRLEQVRR